MGMGTPLINLYLPKHDKAASPLKGSADGTGGDDTSSLQFFFKCWTSRAEVNMLFSGTGDTRKEQAKLLLLSAKYPKPSLDTGRLCGLSFPQNVLV